jgi:hypothetical protein
MTMMVVIIGDVSTGCFALSESWQVTRWVQGGESRVTPGYF